MEDIAYRLGDVIVETCDPFCKVLLPSARSTHCQHCFQRVPAWKLPCSGCQVVKYCSEGCRAEHWCDIHAFECQSPGYLYSARSWACEVQAQLHAVYAVLHATPGMEHRKFSVPWGPPRCFSQLTASTSTWRTERNLQDICTDLARNMMKEDQNVTADYFLRLFSTFRSNSYPIVVDNGTVIGHALYMSATCFDHSCKPNAVRHCENGQLQVRALVNIPRGVRPTLSYFDFSYEDTATRHRLLQKLFKFQCRCVKCKREGATPFDYSLVQAMSATLAGAIDKRYPDATWRDIRGIHDVVLDDLRVLFHEYDRVITMHFIRLAEFARRRFATKVYLELKKEAVRHVSVMAGERSALYRKVTTEPKNPVGW